MYECIALVKNMLSCKLEQGGRSMKRNRENMNRLRPVHIITDVIKHPEGSVLIQVGDKNPSCNESIEDRVPPFLRGPGKGCSTAEYAMLPRATEHRTRRQRSQDNDSASTIETQ